MYYEDFTIRISSGRDGQYTLFVSSPMGSAEASLTLPYARNDLPGVVEGIALQVRRPRARDRDGAHVATDTARNVTGRRAGTSVVPRDAMTVGVQLYAALFQGKVKEALDGSRGRLAGSGKGLRIRLEMNLRGEGMRVIASLPWELMRPHLTDLPLAASTSTPVVRVLDVMGNADLASFTLPLNVLVIISNPAGTAPLDLEKEKDRIRTSWGRVDGVDVHFVSGQVRAITARMHEHDFQVVHYMGHGGFDPDTGEGILYLENEDGSPNPLGGERLKAVFGVESHTLRLVFLNACQTAVATERHELDPFAGIATTIVGLGVPAVVAMQFPITDAAAVMFADTFYRSLVDGSPVDAAVARSRHTLFTEGTTHEWATPVLFMRSRQGPVIDPSGQMGPGRPARLTLLAAPTLALLAMLVGANHWRMATDVEFEIVAPRVVFTIANPEPVALLGRNTAFSELEVDGCASMSFTAADFKALRPITLRSTPGNHAFTCSNAMPRSTIALKAPGPSGVGVGTLGQLLADPGATVELRVATPTFTVGVSNGQELSIPVDGIFQIATDYTDLSEPPIDQMTRGMLRTASAEYEVRLDENRRSIELRTAAQTTLVVTPPQGGLAMNLIDDDVLLKARSMTAGDSTLGDNRMPPLKIALSYPERADAPQRVFTDAYLEFHRSTVLDVRSLAIEGNALTLRVQGRMSDKSSGEIKKGSAVTDPRLTAWERAKYHPRPLIPWATAATLWLASTVALWWVVNRRLGRAAAGAAR